MLGVEEVRIYEKYFGLFIYVGRLRKKFLFLLKIEFIVNFKIGWENFFYGLERRC